MLQTAEFVCEFLFHGIHLTNIEACDLGMRACGFFKNCCCTFELTPNKICYVLPISTAHDDDDDIDKPQIIV